MADFSAARRAMVDSQLRTTGVTERRLLAAMGSTAREDFVPPARRAIAYIDDHHVLSDSLENTRFLAAPSVFGRLVQMAAINSDDRVLDVGAGTGYSTAILAQLGAHVMAVESDADLAEAARAALQAAEFHNAVVVTSLEKVNQKSFDVIVVEGALFAAPDDLLARLNVGGRLVAMIRQRRVGCATIYTRDQDAVTSRSEFNANLPPLEKPPTSEDFVF